MNVGGGIPGRFGMAGGAAGGMSDQQLQEQQMIRTMQMVMESCPGKSVIAGGMGFGLGAFFGLFMSSMRYDTPMNPQLSPLGTPITELPIRQQLKHGLKDMGKASFSSAKNFGMIGAIFSGTECTIEGLRGKNDLWNGISAGCLTGGALAVKGGPQAVALGCAGFAAFSAAIDAYMRMEESEKRMPVV
ncbi:TIM22 protein [Aulographum hederae CBS 113979]|uniref:Mitochondrial import inner membrane translocase subunit TIM22 n=1 Tax=Aulographum hederae CBS 113979 TaxID=1176131 RepID=A0A6G1HE30_9PEZI|nr:TIM22 protein [Aulographum hederae CBS 113979]